MLQSNQCLNPFRTIIEVLSQKDVKLLRQDLLQTICNIHSPFDIALI